MGRKKKLRPLKLNIRTETIHSIVAVILISFGLLVIVSLSGQGAFLSAINNFLTAKLGASLLFLPFVFISSGMVMFRTKWLWSKPHVLLGTILLMFGFLGVFQTGEVGLKTFLNTSQLISPAGTYVVFFSLLCIGALIITQLSIHEIVELLNKLKIRKKEVGDKQEALISEDEIKKARGFKLPKLGFSLKKTAEKTFSINKGASIPEDHPEHATGTAVSGEPVGKGNDSETELPDALSGNLSPSSKKVIWEYPPLSLLSNSDGGEADRGDVKHNASTIENTLESFGIRAKVKEVNFGPSVTQYALEITRGTKLSKITALSTDLALALAAPGGQIRIEAPIAGRSLVGIEVPNHTSEFVTLRKLLASPLMKKQKSKLAVALGINVAGQPLVADIAKMPHVLIAGSTGSGKSVCINTFMCSILFRSSPDEVKFILVDPKRVELTAYNNIPHLLTPVIVDPKKVVSALKWATKEMENRYKQLAEVGVKNIEGYNELAGHAAMPNIVIVIDELADIMLFAPSEVEESVTRIAQMARAVGIHLVLATQRPSVDVITGLIKANIPTRIAFNVSSMTDSRVVLDTPGAEKLLGKGDMLYIPPDQARPSRVQGTFVSEPEIRNLIDFIKSQGQSPEYSDDITEKYQSSTISGGSGSASGGGDDKDELFDEVVKYVAQMGKGSSSSIQRRFSVGYNRAARILDQLEDAGLVGEAQGAKPRDVHTAKIMEYFRNRETSHGE
ncbi:MAG: DNA translocase FtsK [Patescibacteria group bacterium]|nr:MAG: DNA translocase FtsK [Patescibacteria group bacterium]